MIWSTWSLDSSVEATCVDPLDAGPTRTSARALRSVELRVVGLGLATLREAVKMRHIVEMSFKTK